MTNEFEIEMMRFWYSNPLFNLDLDGVRASIRCYRKKFVFSIHAFRHSMKLVYIVTIMDYRIKHHLYSVVFFSPLFTSSVNFVFANACPQYFRQYLIRMKELLHI